MPTKTTAKHTPRDDAEIAREIRRKLKPDLDTLAARINITVISGAVTLQGTVANLLDREAAQSRAAKVKGVRFIENHLLVESGPPPFEV